MNFRSDINGLRAIAVLSVVVFHFFPNALPGGFSGVDIFFVISGYLMTLIIVTRIDDYSFSILRFYLDRAKRIIPALLVLSVFLLIYGWFFLLPADYRELSKQIASSLTFTSNIFYLREAGYFTASAHEKWLLHTWSLSAEWQFYIVYPLILLTVKYFFGRDAFIRSVFLLVSVSFLLSLYMSFYYAEQAYYMVYTRAWQMLAGALVFLVPVSFNRAFLINIVGVTFICMGFVFASVSTPWPGYISLFSVLGTCLVLYANYSSTLINSRLVQWFGTHSYSIYLWHWPVVVKLSFLGLFDSVLFSLAGVLVSFLLGFLSFKLVEQNKKFKYYFGSLKSNIFIVFPIVAVTSLIFIFEGVQSKYRPVSVSDKSNFIEMYKDKHQNLAEAYWLKCNSYEALISIGSASIDKSCVVSGKSGGVFLWGDSHAEALSLGIRSLLVDEIPFYQVTSAGCRASFDDNTGLLGQFDVACRASNRFAIEQLKLLQPTVLVVAQQSGHDQVDWIALAKQVKALGVEHFMLIGPVPQWRPSLPAVYVRRHWDSNSEFIFDRAFDSSLVTVNKAAADKLNTTDITYVDILAALCKTEDEKYFCKAKVDDTLLVVDYGHLSEQGSVYVAEQIIMPKLSKLLVN